MAKNKRKNGAKRRRSKATHEGLAPRTALTATLKGQVFSALVIVGEGGTPEVESDGLGSTTDLTDGSGNVIAGYSYDVFGATRSQSGAGDTDFRFTGEQLDTQSELYYLRARYYDPSIGRFLSLGPISPCSYPGFTPDFVSEASAISHSQCEF